MYNYFLFAGQSFQIGAAIMIDDDSIWAALSDLFEITAAPTSLNQDVRMNKISI